MSQRPPRGTTRNPPRRRRTAPTRARGARVIAPYDAGTVADLLTGATTKLCCSLIGEPTLLFGGKQPCEDPKTGLTAYGPYSKTDATRRPIIRIGIVGPAEAVDRARALVERMTTAIPHHEKHDAMLHPGFPGLSDQDPFQTQFVTQPIWCKMLSPASVARIEHHADFTIRVGLLIEDVTREVTALSKLDMPPDVVLIAMTAGLEKQCRVGIAQYDQEQRDADDDEDDAQPSDVIEELDEQPTEDDEPDENDEQPPSTARSFRRGLKAACMHLLPTQLLWHRTLAGTKGVQDLATRAWNLSVALLYKARVIPWRLGDVIDGSCFVGVSFFHPDNQPNTTRTSIAQAFTHTGEGFVLQGDNFTWKPTREERSPHLDRDAAAALIKQVLDTYEDEVHTLPQRLVLHKTSRYTAAEIEGFTSALRGVRDYALVTLSRRGVVVLRPGNKPALRGTTVDFGDKKGLVYTIGYIPYLRCYPGFRIPQPLEITENHGNQTFTDIATDLLRLTKLNWNTAAFCCVDPITIAFSKRIGEILKIANTDKPARHYRQYM